MKARNRRSGFDVTAIRMPHPFKLGGADHPAGTVIVRGPKGGQRVYDVETFNRLYEITEADQELTVDA